jgi:hypothetical protein
MATIGIAAMDKLGTLGTPAQDARARSFARFVQGVAFGNLALAYDSASIVSETDGAQDIVPLSYYPDVMAAAILELDSAITIARNNSGAFPLPNTWVNGVALDTTGFFRLIRSYKARFRASVGRTPAERATADWAAIIADADAGITADFNISMNPAAGWDVVWPIQASATGPANWHQMSQSWMGMADSSGGYDAWLNETPSLRQPFVVVTADQRFPRGLSCLAPCAPAVRTSQIADSNRAGFRTFTGFPYVRNRQPGEDQPGNPLQISMYDFYRSRSFFSAGRTGPYPIMTRAEIRLYAAEGYIRAGNWAAATARIDSSRTLNGQLPSVATLVDTIAAVPGGAACVPRVPNLTAAFKASKCGNLWDALKWEYRMETAYTGYGMWYFAGRGWGDLPEGTALYWPVPYQEMDTRRQAFYSAGGPNQTGGAPSGNYGLFTGGVY